MIKQHLRLFDLSISTQNHTIAGYIHSTIGFYKKNNFELTVHCTMYT